MRQDFSGARATDADPVRGRADTFPCGSPPGNTKGGDGAREGGTLHGDFTGCGENPVIGVFGGQELLRILYIEDDPTAREYIRKGLSEHGYAVDAAEDGKSGVERALRDPFDLLILDVMLPDSDGFEVLRSLRAKGVHTPVLFLSARGEVADRIQGLNLGADDYLVKPFAFAELLARIQAVARRSLSEPDDGRLTVADLVLDLRRHAVERSGRSVELTPKEFDLLEYLLRNAGLAVSRAMITEKVWGYGFDTYSNLIDVHINHLRKKVDQDFGPKLIHTVKGVGYMLEDRGRSGEGE